jgi:hypothetical protein
MLLCCQQRWEDFQQVCGNPHLHKVCYPRLLLQCHVIIPVGRDLRTDLAQFRIMRSLA